MREYIVEKDQANSRSQSSSHSVKPLCQAPSGILIQGTTLLNTEGLFMWTGKLHNRESIVPVTTIARNLATLSPCTLSCICHQFIQSVDLSLSNAFIHFVHSAFRLFVSGRKLYQHECGRFWLRYCPNGLWMVCYDAAYRENNNGEYRGFFFLCLWSFVFVLGRMFYADF